MAPSLYCICAAHSPPTDYLCDECDENLLTYIEESGTRSTLLVQTCSHMILIDQHTPAFYLNEYIIYVIYIVLVSFIDKYSFQN